MVIISNNICSASTYSDDALRSAALHPFPRPSEAPHRTVARRAGGYGGWVGQTAAKADRVLLSAFDAGPKVREVTGSNATYCVSEDGCLVQGQIT